jgi:hypothetical protein
VAATCGIQAASDLHRPWSLPAVHSSGVGTSIQCPLFGCRCRIPRFERRRETANEGNEGCKLECQGPSLSGVILTLDS